MFVRLCVVLAFPIALAACTRDRPTSPAAIPRGSESATSAAPPGGESLPSPADQRPALRRATIDAVKRDVEAAHARHDESVNTAIERARE
jgi:hypothetical protein